MKNKKIACPKCGYYNYSETEKKFIKKYQECPTCCDHEEYENKIKNLEN